jgi:predicted nucleic acid-binding protein
MILYLGGSSVVKLYAHEDGSELVKAWVRSADFVATCRTTYTEVISALNIRYRRGDLSKDDYNTLARVFIEDWKNYVRIDFDDYEAGNLSMKYDLSRLSAIHLSAAKLILNANNKRGDKDCLEHNGGHGLTVFFSSADPVLCKAASAEGLTVLPLK